MSHRYRDTSADVLANLFLARVESPRLGDTLELKEEIDTRSWPEKEVWNRIIEDAAKKKVLKTAGTNSLWV